MNYPEGATIIAEGGGYTLFTYESKIDRSAYYILRGLSSTDFVFTKNQWDLFAAFVNLADLKMEAMQ